MHLARSGRRPLRAAPIPIGPAPRAQRAGLSLLEVVVAAVLAALMVSGFAATVTTQASQLTWIESRSGSSGVVTPFGVVSSQQEILATGIDVTQQPTIDVNAVSRSDEFILTAVVTRRMSTTADYGREP